MRYCKALSLSLAALMLLTAITGCDDHSVTSIPTIGLYGDWRVVLAGGKNLRDLDIEIIWTISESTITVRDGTGEQVSQNNYDIDESQEPKHIDMHIRDITNEDRYGIYELDGDELRISFSLEGGKRPTDWSEVKPMVFEKVSATGTQ